MRSENEVNNVPLKATYEDSIKLYPSWVETLNHYSDLVMRIRITAITSGIIILAAAGTLLLKEGNLTACRMVCIFGIFFSVVLLFMLRNYYNHYTAWLDIVTKVEKKMKLPDEMQTWTIYKEEREKRWDCTISIVRYGWTTLIIIAAFIIFLMTCTNSEVKKEQKEGLNIRTNQVIKMNSEVVC